MEVAICIATCRRPNGLARLLDGLAGLSFAAGAPDLRVIVVDNDPDWRPGVVRAVVARAAPRLAGPTEYLSEPRRGISFARNRGLESALRSDFIAFIDDDERPAPHWLDELLRVQSAHAADGVGGPVLPAFETPPPEWVLKGRFFDAEHRPDGAPLDVLYTGNALVRAQVLRETGLRFDERFALTGGEDGHLFRRLRRRGYELRWAERAVVHETVPPDRLTPGYILARDFSIGARATRVRRELDPGAAGLLRLILEGAERVGLGLLGTAFYIFGPRHRRLRELKSLMAGLGGFAGLFGIQWRAYRRIDGA